MKKLLQKIPMHTYVAMSGWLSRLVVAPVQLIAIPIFYQKLGLQDFAVFTVITGLSSWYSLMDFGIGMALQNYISEFRVQKKNPGELLKKVFPLIVLISLMLIMLIIVLGKIFEQWLFSNLTSSLSPFNFTCILILYCWYFLSLIGTKVFFAYQRGFYGYLYQTVAYVILLGLIAILHFFVAHITLAAALYLWVLPLLIFGMIGFFHSFNLSGSIFSAFKWDFSFYPQLFSRAIRYWLVAISNNGVLAIDYLVIVKMLSAKDIVTYNVVNKIFVMMLFIFATALSALWPTLAEHYAKKSTISAELAERELRKAIIGGTIYMIIATCLIIIFSREILHLFTLQRAIELPVTLILLFGLYGCIRVWSDTYSVALQARNLTHIFLYQTPVQAVIAVLAMLVLAKYHLIGIMLALILSFILVPVWILPLYHYRDKKTKL